MKETFILRTEWYDAIKELSDVEQAIILRSLFEYHLGNDVNTTSFSITLKLVWSLLLPNIKRNILSYDKRSKTSAANGLLGGRPLKTNNLINLTEKPNKPIKTLSVSVSDTVSDSDTDSVNESDIKEFEQFWNLYDKKVGDRKKLISKWQNLKPAEREQIFLHVPKYKAAQPDKKFRKDPSTYLNNKAWNDEIIGVVIAEPTKRPLPEGWTQEQYDNATTLL